MKKFLIAAYVLALSVGSLSARNPNPQKAVYIIDGKRVERFDGSQLVGKTITSYEIGPDAVHVIFTSDYTPAKPEPLQVVSATAAPMALGTDGCSRTITIVGSGTHVDAEGSVRAEHFGPENVVYVVDGKEVSSSEFAALNFKRVKEIQVVKSKDHPVYRKYVTDEARQAGVILVTLK